MVSATQKRKKALGFILFNLSKIEDLGHLVVRRHQRSPSHGYSESSADSEQATQQGYDGEDDEDSGSDIATRKKRTAKAKWKNRRGASIYSSNEANRSPSKSPPGAVVTKAYGATPESPSHTPWYTTLNPADEWSSRSPRARYSVSIANSCRGPEADTPAISDDEFHSYNESLESLTAADLGHALQKLSTSTHPNTQSRSPDVEMAGPSNSGHPARSSSAISTHTSTPLHGAPSNDRALPPLFAQSLRPTRVPTPEHPPQVEEVHDQHETSPETPSAESQTNTASSSNGAPLASSDLIAITNTLRTLAHGLERVSEAMEKQHTLLASKIDALQTSSGPASRSPRSTATRRSRDHPYQRTEPEKRKQSHKLLSSSIRKHLDKLLDAHDDPFVSPEQSASFDLLVKKDPARRCCDVAHFQIDLQHGPHSPWNVSAALVFAEDYMQAHQPMDRIDDVTHAFFTRVKSIKQFLNERPDRREAKTQYGRKYGLFYRRLEAVLAFPDSKIHQDIVKMLGVDGMSSDEEDGADDNNPSYRVLTPRWRSTELTTFLHGLDSLYIVHRRLDSSRQRGNWPRPRRYDPLHPKISSKTGYPRHLPRNAYDQGWLASFPNVTLSVNPSLPYNFNHSPAVFQHLLGMQCAPS